MNRNSFNARGGNRRTQNSNLQRLSQQVRGLKLIAKQANAVTPFRIQPNRNMSSTPDHNRQMKIRKMFRVAERTETAADTTFSTADVLTAVQNELGIAASTTAGEIISIHGGRVYMAARSAGVSVAPQSETLTVQLFDIEESTSTTNATRSSCFEDVFSAAGVGHVAFVYPVNNRPTFTRDFAATALLVAGAPHGQGLLTVDLDITYVRTPGPQTSLLEVS